MNLSLTPLTRPCKPPLPLSARARGEWSVPAAC
jgi:hypothetical protein